jgi:solute carrier family 25 uncoupling protein 8/9
MISSHHTALSFSGYDGLKTVAKQDYGVQDGPLLHAASSVSASFFASFFSAPADYVMARYMSSASNSSLTVTDCVRMIYKEGGIRAFWKGWSVFFVRLTPVLLTYSSVYEQLRYELGLGYMD